MISNLGRKLVAQPLAQIVAWIQDTGITPNALSIIGFILTGVSALLIAFGYFLLGGVVLFCAGFFDMLDGALARATQQSSVFGAFIDSTLDRYSESITLFAFVYYYSVNFGHSIELILVFLILVGSLMVSYVRARAEALNIECKGGLLQRPERVLLLIFGLVTGWIVPVLWIQAIFTNISAIQRIFEVYARTRQKAVDSDATSSTPKSQKAMEPRDSTSIQR
ncbi:MAG: CDP-alcohol phosphatidyltransferase family protein [Litorilinea sp.]